MSSNKSSKIKESNIELLRIISMFYIVLYHLIIHSNMISNSIGLTKYTFLLIESLTLVHVNSFILITGYFQSNSKFKSRKILSLNNQVWFYKVVIPIALIILGIIAIPDTVTIFKTIMPIDYGTYWYVNTYILLYLLSPFLNKIINGLSKKNFKLLLTLLIIFISFIPTFTRDESFNTYSGRSLITFILLYFIGAYIRKYSVEDDIFEKKSTPSNRKKIFFGGYILLTIISFVFVSIGIRLERCNATLQYIGIILQNFHASYASPIIILQTVCYFLLFKNIKIKSKIINFVSSYTFSVYLISENAFARSSLYSYFGFDIISNYSFKWIIYSILISCFIFVLCICIELIVNFITKQISKLSIISNQKEKIYSKLKNVDLLLNNL